MCYLRELNCFMGCTLGYFVLRSTFFWLNTVCFLSRIEPSNMFYPVGMIYMYLTLEGYTDILYAPHKYTLLDYVVAVYVLCLSSRCRSVGMHTVIVAFP